IRGLRIEPLADIPGLLFRRAVTVDAGPPINAESVTRTLIRQLKGSGYVRGMTLHRTVHGRGQEPLEDSGFRRAGSNIIDARICNRDSGNAQNDEGGYKAQYKFHILAPTSPGRTMRG